MRRRVLTIALACLLPGQALAHTNDLLTLKQSIVATYAKLVFASYEDSLAGVRALAESVDTFVESPSEAALERARQAWIAARVPYTQTEACRFYDGPIETVEGMINSWPIDEN